MSALAANRQAMIGPREMGTVRGKIAANVHIFLGALCAIVGGYWQPVTAITGLEGRYGIAMEEVDNTGGAAGAKAVDIQFIKPKTCVLLKNDVGASPVAAINLGDKVFFKDDQTISLSDAGGTRSEAGNAIAFLERNLTENTGYVWVEV